MGKIHAGATLTPHFRDFLPGWLVRQPWYAGSGLPKPVGFFRFEDPAGEVGVETHLVQAADVVYQVPMTYRGTPLAGAALIATAEHSVLGTRWIYDAVTDPVWCAAVLNLVATNGKSDPSGRSQDAEAIGVRLSDVELTPQSVRIDVDRVVAPKGETPDAVGVVTSEWGRLAVLRPR